jgi:hypothetical protein
MDIDPNTPAILGGKTIKKPIKKEKTLEVVLRIVLLFLWRSLLFYFLERTST